MNLAEITVDTFGGSPVAEHNMPCAVCRNKHAVLDMNTGKFQPCWGCQKSGWALVKRSWLGRWLHRND